MPTPSEQLALRRHEVRGWFFGAPLSAIHSENLAEWLAWTFFGTVCGGLADELIG
jgi:hypothetical protein